MRDLSCSERRLGGREREKAAAKVKKQHEGSDVFQTTCSDTTAFSSLATSERVHEGIAKPFGILGVCVCVGEQQKERD